jgi:hypothetical protein
MNAMKLGVRLLRLLHPKQEAERMQYRKELHYAEAHCEHLQRLLKKVMNGHDRSEILPKK